MTDHNSKPHMSLPGSEGLATAKWLGSEAAARRAQVIEQWEREGHVPTKAEKHSLDEECRLSVGPVDVDSLRESLKTFWEKHEPSKLPTLDKCMERFKGFEHRLVVELEVAEADVAQFGSLEAAMAAHMPTPPAPTPAVSSQV